MKKIAKCFNFFGQHTENDTRTSTITLASVFLLLSIGIFFTASSDSETPLLFKVFSAVLVLFYLFSVCFQLQHPVVPVTDKIRIKTSGGEIELSPEDMVDAANSLFKDKTPEQAVCKMWALLSTEERHRMFEEHAALVLSLYMLEDSRKVAK